MTLIATPLSASANSFATVAEADLYHLTRGNNAEWSGADSVKETALIQATKMLNRQTWTGQKQTSTQALKFPRFSLYDDDGYLIASSVIPNFLIEATAELAWLLLISDPTRESGTKGFKSIGVGPISLSVEKSDRTNPIPSAVYAMIKPWLRSGGMLQVARG